MANPRPTPKPGPGSKVTGVIPSEIQPGRVDLGGCPPGLSLWRFTGAVKAVQAREMRCNRLMSAGGSKRELSDYLGRGRAPQRMVR